MSREEDDEHMHELRQRPPEQLWFYSEDGVLYAVTERVADAMSPGRLIGPYAYVAGDGTPGPARPAAPDEEGAPTPAEAGRWEVDCEPGLYAYTVSNGLRTFRTEYLGNAERLATWLNAASADSGGPREALRAAKEIAFDWLHTDPDDPAGPVMTRVHDAKAGWEAMRRIYDILDAALRAELGRAPNGWEQAAQEIEFVAGKWRANSPTRGAMFALAAKFRARADAELGRAGTEPNRSAKAWKRLAHVLATDLRVARKGGADLAQEAFEADELLTLLVSISAVEHEEDGRCRVTFWDEDCNEWDETAGDLIAVLRRVRNRARADAERREPAP